MVYGMNRMIEMHAVWEEFDGFDAVERDDTKKRSWWGQPTHAAVKLASSRLSAGPWSARPWVVVVALEDVQDITE